MIIQIPKILINKLISHTNIVDLINKKVPLKKQGSNFIACCPFHKEKYPSFTVNPEKQFYYCFSCKTHGNIINFLMNYNQLTFIESIKQLSTINGISINHFLKTVDDSENHKKNNLYQLMSDICNFYQSNLINKKYSYAYSYLKSRGFTDHSISEFKIGFAPTEWNNIIKNINFKPYNQDIINQSGMWVKNKKNIYDRFRGRIMFPIQNKLGKIIAFGGRIIQNNQKIPKYLNSPDTNIFKKNQHLYGFYEICKKHKNPPYLLLVEGYIDVIILTQFGINYAVSSLGTSISTYHIQLIYSITNQIICCYDGDYAGNQAAWRTLNTILPHLTDNREIYFMFLPNKEDPDTLIRKIGKNNFLKQINQAQSLSYFLFKTLSKQSNLQTLEGRVKFTNLILPMINKIPGKILKLFLRQELGNKIGILDDYKLNKLLTIQKTLFFSTKNKNDITNNIEHILIRLLIQNPKLAKLVPTVQGLEKSNHNKIIIFLDLVKICKSYPNLNTEQLLELYHKNTKKKYFTNLKILIHWKHMIANDMITITFINTLIKLYNLILENRQNTLISRDRISTLTKEERQELWLLNQTLSIN